MPSRRFFLLCLTALSALAVHCAAVGASAVPDGYFDGSFAGDGSTVTPWVLDDRHTAPIVLHGADLLLMAGTCALGMPQPLGNVCVNGFHLDGSLAGGFGVNGGVATLAEMGLPDTALDAAAIAADGRIWLAVRHGAGEQRIVVLAADGSAIVAQSLDLAAALAGSGRELKVAALVPTGDGGVLVGGTATQATLPDSAWFAVLRLQPGLAGIDGGFGDGGLATVRFYVNCCSGPDFAVLRRMALQADGKIVLAGSASEANSRDSVAALARLTPDGVLDHGFGIDGQILDRFGVGMHAVSGLAIARHGRVVIGGTTDDYYPELYGSEFVINRLLPDGDQDPVFGKFEVFDDAGPVVYGADRGGNNNDVLEDLVLQPDGRIVAVGYGDMLRAGSPVIGFEAIRLWGGNGQPDLGFGVQATSMGSFDCPNGSSRDRSFSVSMARGIVLAGTCHALGSPDDERHYALARLRVDGIFQAGFEQ